MKSKKREVTSVQYSVTSEKKIVKRKMSEGARGKGQGAGGQRSEASGQLATAKPEGRRREARKANGFTLVELLAVIAIMTILFIVAVPSLETFTRKGLSTSIAPLTTTLRLARQYAVTHRETVHVVFPTVDAITSYSGSDVDRALRSYAVIASNSAGYYYVSDWRYLPKGVSFIPDRPGTKYNRDALKSYDPGSGTLFPFPPNPNFVRMPAIQFRPNGRAYFHTGSEWNPVSDIKVPITSSRYFEVATNTGTVGPSTHVAGSTNTVMVRGLTGQISVLYEGDEDI